MPHANATACPPRLSVVITAYNEGEELGRTIESVRAHTEQSYEVIVVDDGSTDGKIHRLQRSVPCNSQHPKRRSSKTFARVLA